MVRSVDENSISWHVKLNSVSLPQKTEIKRKVFGNVLCLNEHSFSQLNNETNNGSYKDRFLQSAFQDIVAWRG